MLKKLMFIAQRSKDTRINILNICSIEFDNFRHRHTYDISLVNEI